MERGFMDEGENSLMYPLRGIKEGTDWILGAVTYDDIESLKTDFFYSAYDLYVNFEMFGNALGGGWAGERRTVLDIVKIFKCEENAFDAWEMEKNNRSK